MKLNVKDFVKNVRFSLGKNGRALFEFTIGGFIAVSIALYLTSCYSSMDAEKFHYHGSVGKSQHVTNVIVHPDSVR